MRRITKILVYLLTVAFMLVPGMSVHAGTINANEQALLDFGNSVFSYNGVDYVATEAAKESARNYLMQNDVNLSAAQAEEARSEFYANLGTAIAEGYMVPVSTPAPEEEEKPAEDKPVENKPTEDKPADNAPAEDKPAEDTPAEDTSAENKPAEGMAEENKTAGDKTTGNKPAEDISSGDVSAGDNTNGDASLIGDASATEPDKDNMNTPKPDTTESETETNADSETVTDNDAEEKKVSLREKNFKKGIDVSSIAIVVCVITFVLAVALVAYHKHRGYRK